MKSISKQSLDNHALNHEQNNIMRAKRAKPDKNKPQKDYNRKIKWIVQGLIKYHLGLSRFYGEEFNADIIELRNLINKAHCGHEKENKH
jgi:hypothetical protein